METTVVVPLVIKAISWSQGLRGSNAWAAFDEGIVMSTTVPAIVARL
jgi:hypothetical protein